MESHTVVLADCATYAQDCAPQIGQFFDWFFNTWQTVVLDHLLLWLFCAGVVFVLYVIARIVYENYEDEMGNRFYLAKYHSATPPEERQRNLEKVVDTAIASLPRTLRPVEELRAMTELDRRTAHLNLAEGNNM